MLNCFIDEHQGAISLGETDPFNTPPTSRNLSPEHEVPAESTNPVSLRNYDCDMWYDTFASKNFINPNDMYINDYFTNDLNMTIDTPTQSDNDMESDDFLGTVNLDHPYCSSLQNKKENRIIPKHIKKIEKPTKKLSCKKTWKKYSRTLTLQSITEQNEPSNIESSQPSSPDSDSNSSVTSNLECGDLYSFISMEGPSTSSSTNLSINSERNLNDLSLSIITKRPYVRRKLTDGIKRASHNEKERQRRGDLKNNLEWLRRLVPDVSSRPKASMASVLVEATKFISMFLSEENLTEKLLTRHEYLNRQYKELLSINDRIGSI